MTPARRLLLAPLLAPLLALLLLAALNPAPRLSLRLLTWRSAPLPLGAWLAMAASGGALVSASAVGLALGQAGRLPWSERRRSGSAATLSGDSNGDDRWRPSSREPWEAEPPPPRAAQAAARNAASGFSAGPSRAVGEPAPTVAVPFRVIQRPGERVAATATTTTTTAATATAAPTQPARAATPARSQPEPAGPSSDGQEGWGSPLLEDW
ncbi:MAG: hypothetical protein ACK5N0_14865 [Synechococcaceae cyanobacterium]